MGNYDSIQSPISGTPISKSQYGDRVRAAIVDLDRRVSAYDASTGVGKAYATAAINLSNTNETILLTIQDYTFRAGFAYKAYFRSGISSAVAGTVINLRLRKGDTLTLVGGTATNNDYGEYFRYEGKGAAGVMGALGTIYLLRSAGTDLTTDVSLTGQSSVAAANAITSWANTTSPRYLTIEPAGFASDFIGMGVDVT